MLFFVVGNKIGKTFEGIILLPVHVRFYFTIKAYRYFIFSKTLCNARGAAVRMIYWIAAAFMVDARTEWDFHINDLLS